ncbi:MAG: hypothetical protein ACYC1S_05375 [Gemmatimonadaceae bacterium]
MTRKNLLALVALTAISTPAMAQLAESAPTKDSTAAEAAKPSLVQISTIARLRPNDARGINVFEAPKAEDVPFTGFKFQMGGAFTQQFQGLDHSNTAATVTKTDAKGQAYNANRLITIGHGFNNAVANLYLNAQLAKGIRVAMTQYLSSRHHAETWAKDGYLLIDASPIDFAPLNEVMKYVTIKAGHFEVNYGDGHFRRTDNGNAMYNPLVGNYILDAFTTQVGGEVYLRAKGAFLMGSVTNGEVRGTILNAAKRAPAFYGKAGVDKYLTSDLRVRLSGSWMGQARSANQTIYSGDRAGSRYYDVLENTASTEAAQAWSGAIQPFSGPTAGLHAAVINPFIKFKGLEYFGAFESATGRGAFETANRTIKQSVNELTYRLPGNALYVAGRYNTVSGRLAGLSSDISVSRSQVGAGWFITPIILTKIEYVNQKYDKFPVSDIRNGGEFKGFMIEGTVAF